MGTKLHHNSNAYKNRVKSLEKARAIRLARAKIEAEYGGVVQPETQAADDSILPSPFLFTKAECKVLLEAIDLPFNRLDAEIREQAAEGEIDQVSTSYLELLLVYRKIVGKLEEATK
jgi:hypothetical protein